MSSIKHFLHSSSSRGVTTTHPWCSVFTRISSFIVSVIKQLSNIVKSMAEKFSKMKDNSKKTISAVLCIMLVLVSGANDVYAEAFPIPPIWLPLNPYNAQGLEGNYVLLNDDQKKIVNETIGAYSMVYLGMGQYALTNPVQGLQATRRFFQEYGSTFLETFWTQVMGTSRAMTDFVGSTIYKASTYDTYEEYEQETAPSVTSSNHKYFEISPELTVAFKNWYRANGGVEDWQTRVEPFTSSVQYIPVDNGLSGINLANYNSLVNSLIEPKVRVNNLYQYQDYSGIYISSRDNNNNMFLTYSNLFVNTTNHTVNFYSDNGNAMPTASQSYNLCKMTYVSKSGNNYSVNDGLGQLNGYFLQSASYNPNNYNAYVDIVRDVYNGVIKTSTDWYFVFLEDFVKHVYVGADWSSKQEIYNVEDLNIGTTPSQYIDNISDTGFVDINKLIGQIADEVVNLREVVEDSVLVKDGTDAIPYSEALTRAIDKYMTEPESKVIIVPGLFKNLGKYITYLYEQAKPLVLYTRDLITAFTFDGTGMSWVFFGAVSCGLIGGVLCKFLL